MSNDTTKATADTALEPARIDLSQYRTAELAAQLTELISVPGALGKVFKTTFVVSILFAVTCYVAFGFSHFSAFLWLFACTYSLGAGICLGLMLGILRVVATALLNVESILRIILDITGRAAQDYEQVQAGEMRMPTATELLSQVYDDVIVPVLERAVTGAFGFLSRPLLWAYRRTIGGAVRYLIKRVPVAQAEADQAQQVVDKAEAGMGQLARYSDSIQAFTMSAAEIVASVGQKIRTYAMLPLYVALAIALILATIPVVILRSVATPAS